MTTSTPAAEMRSPSYVSELLGMLVGRDMKLTQSDGHLQLGHEPGFVGVYRKEDDTVGGILISDLAFGAHCGCALALIPVGEAEQAIKAGRLPESVRDNYAEVVNVASRLYITPNTPRVIFRELHEYPCKLPRDVLQYIARPIERVDYEVSIDGYGDSRFAMLIR